MKQHEITQEMRDERLATAKHNDDLWAAHKVLTDAWDLTLHAHQISFLVAAQVPEKYHDTVLHGSRYKKRSENRKYKIEKLKVI